MSRDEARRQLGRAAVFSESEAVRLLPFRDATARAWLRDQGLVHCNDALGRYVVWDEVLIALGRNEQPQEEHRRAASRLPRAGLRR